MNLVSVFQSVKPDDVIPGSAVYRFAGTAVSKNVRETNKSEFSVPPD